MTALTFALMVTVVGFGFSWLVHLIGFGKAETTRVEQMRAIWPQGR